MSFYLFSEYMVQDVCDVLGHDSGQRFIDNKVWRKLKTIGTISIYIYIYISLYI